MMNRLRTPLLFLAILLSFLVLLIETGTALPGVLQGTSLSLTNLQLPAQVSATANHLTSDQQQVLTQVSRQSRPPGASLPDLALLDSIQFFTLALMGVAVFIPARIQGKIQGVVTLIFALTIITTAIRQIFVALASLVLMIALFLAIPFGTLIYLIVYGSFNRGGADAVLGILMLLEFGIAFSLLFAQQRFLESKGLILLILSSFIGVIVINFLLGLVPRILASITDAIAAIVVCIIAVIWAIILLIGAIISIIRVLRLARKAS
jgi:hypothetical protein